MTAMIRPWMADNFWKGAQGRIDILLGRDHKGWFKRTIAGLYDMGQNIGILIAWALKKRQINWLQIPGFENCSSAVASIFACGFDAVSLPSMWIFGGLNLKETSEIAPCHFPLSGQFKRLNPGDPIRKGCIKFNLSYHTPNENIIQLLIRFIKNFGNIKKSWTEFSMIFRDGIMITQRDKFHAPDPYWRITHAELTVDVSPPGIIELFSQEAKARQYGVSQNYLWADMGGEQPRYIVMEPTFLYD